MRALRYVSLAVWLFAGTQVYGQSGGYDFRGRLLDGPGRAYDGYFVEIANPLNRSNPLRADVSSDGAFAFRSVPDGEYMVRVLTLYGAEAATTVTSIGPSSIGTMFEIRLPHEKMQHPGTGTVSLQQLNHAVSRQTRKLVESGQKLIEERHFAEAAARLREATQSDPQCAQAYADLGLATSRIPDWDAAIEAYRAASALDPRNSLLHSNLSGALVSAKHFEEARNEATLALKLDPGNVRAHYLLAAALVHEPGHLEEAVSHLAAVQDSFPSARAALQQVCAAKNVAGCP